MTKFTKTLVTLLLTIMPFSNGCEKPKTPSVSKDTNPNYTYTPINIADDKKGLYLALIVDEDRDGEPDYIAAEKRTGGNKIVFLRDGYNPAFPEYTISPDTKVMNQEMRDRCKIAMINTKAIVNYANFKLSHSKR